MKEKLAVINAKITQFEDILFGFLKKYMWIIVMVIAFTLTTIGKTFAFPFLSHDYKNFLVVWMINYEQMGLHDGFGASLSDYTPIYNYFLCIFALSYPQEGWVYAIKIFNIVFELSFAVASFFIVYHCFKNLNYSALAFIIALIIPSIIVNGAFWGQCDVVFSSFIAWSFYFVLRKQYNLAMIFFSISFAFKLQAVFFAPFLFLLILKREVKIWQIIYVPIIYLLFALPALICGRPFDDILYVYVRQANEYAARISLSAPSIYGFFDNKITETMSSLPVVFFFVITLSYVFYLYYKDFELNNENLITVALISLMFSAYFLPHMHERYFFVADLFSVLYIFIKKKGFLIAILINSASLLCCCSYVFSAFGAANMFYPFNIIRVGSILNLVAVVLLTIEMIKIPSKKILDTNSCN